MDKIACITGGGIGDSVLAYQTAHCLRERGYNPFVFVAARAEVTEPINHLFRHLFFPTYWLNNPEYWDIDKLIRDEKFLSSLKQDGYNDVCIALPDELYSSKFAINLKKHHLNPNVIRQTRLLTKQWKPTNLIYCALNSTTQGYSYQNIELLLQKLAEELPNYKIRFPIVKTWNKELTKQFKIEYDRPDNLDLIENPKMLDELDTLKTACYCVTLDNGPSHVAHQLGIPRLLLDPRINQLPWVARWRQDLSESIDIHNFVRQIVKVVKTNLEIPQTQLIPRQEVLSSSDTNWKEKLIIKYEKS